MFFLCLIVQGAFCAHSDCSSSIEVLEHEAVVQCKIEQTLYQVRWATYGILYNDSVSVEEVLERNLLNGEQGTPFFVSDFELRTVLTSTSFGLSACLEKGVRLSYRGLTGERLTQRLIELMLPLKCKKMWQVMTTERGARSDLEEGELRVVLPGGAYSCVSREGEGVPVGRWEVTSRGQLSLPGGMDKVSPCFENMSQPLNPSSQRYALIVQEETDDFQKKLSVLAQEKKRALKKASAEQRPDVFITYMTEDGRKKGAVWDVREVFDLKALNVLDFLHYCVLQGTSLGYTNETERQFAFINNAICRMLKTTLADALEDGQGVQRFESMSPLKAQDVRCVAPFAWTLVASGAQKGPQWKNSIKLAFPGGVLEGVARVDAMGLLPNSLSPRSFLRGADVKMLQGFWVGRLNLKSLRLESVDWRPFGLIDRMPIEWRAEERTDLSAQRTSVVRLGYDPCHVTVEAFSPVDEKKFDLCITRRYCWGTDHFSYKTSVQDQSVVTRIMCAEGDAKSMQMITGTVPNSSGGVGWVSFFPPREHLPVSKSMRLKRSSEGTFSPLFSCLCKVSLESVDVQQVLFEVMDGVGFFVRVHMPSFEDPGFLYFSWGRVFLNAGVVLSEQGCRVRL